MSLKESATYTPDQLISGNMPLQTEPETIKSGLNAVRGTVMGRIDVGAASTAAKAGGNTGGGSITMDVATPVLAGAIAGVYTARCIAAPGGNSGTFLVIDPEGTALGQVIVGATFANKLKFVIADVGMDFALDDGFDITVAAGSKKWTKALAAAVDGSQIPRGIMAEDCDASGADVVGPVYKAGQFDPDKLTYGAGHTEATVRAAFEGTGLYLRDTI